MTARCPSCDAELGPAEDRAGCLTCRKISPVTNPDLVVAVLEKAQVPLAYWDVKRLLDVEGLRIHNGSLLASLSSDPRACWGGAGIYGLYPHGLLPGVRDLGSAATVFLHAAQAGLSQEKISFVLRHVGYRFQSTSIYLALNRMEDSGVVARRWGRWVPTGQSTSPILRLRQPEDVEAVIQRASDQTAVSLAELDRRLG